MWRDSSRLEYNTCFTDMLHGLFNARLLLMHTMTFILVAFILANPVSAFSGGDGSEENPYQISDIEQLQDMKLDLTAHYVLINDIDASDTVNWNGGYR